MQYNLDCINVCLLCLFYTCSASDIMSIGISWNKAGRIHDTVIVGDVCWNKAGRIRPIVIIGYVCQFLIFKSVDSISAESASLIHLFWLVEQ